MKKLLACLLVTAVFLLNILQRVWSGPPSPQAQSFPDLTRRERLIAAPPEAIWALVADPRRHHEIDGSGTVRDAKNMPERLELGSKFGMSMKLGLPYSMVSEVIEFEPDRRIAWQTFPPGPGRYLLGGRIWRDHRSASHRRDRWLLHRWHCRRKANNRQDPELN